MDPFMQAQLMMMLAQNPEMGAQLDAAGIPAPGFLPQAGGMDGTMMGAGNPAAAGGGDLGLAAMMDPTAAGATDPMAAMMAGGPAAGAANAFLPGDIAAAGGALGRFAGGLGGVKAPEPIKPINLPGVGAGRAPEVQKVGGGSLAIQQLMQAMAGGGQNPLRVPDLGSLMRGGRY